MSSSSPVKKTPAGKKRSTVSPTPSTVPLPAPLQPAFVPPVQIRRIPKKLNVFQQAWIWYEGSFAISMLETWEKILLHTFLLGLMSLFYYASSRYLPGQIERVSGRVKWYLFGGEGEVAI